MKEITRLALENEMDLILAHRQSMKLAEFVGLNVANQTSFATAVSEIARIAIDKAKDAFLTLSILSEDRKKFIQAAIGDGRDNFISQTSESYNYAKKLVTDIQLEIDGTHTTVILWLKVPGHKWPGDAEIDNLIYRFKEVESASPYEEIKRKNRQLTALTAKLKASEEQYRTLTHTLPLMIFTFDTAGKLTFANPWMLEYTGSTIGEINDSKWTNIVNREDYNPALFEWTGTAKVPCSAPVEFRLKNYATGEYRWHMGCLTPVEDSAGTVVFWTGYLADIHAQKMVDLTLEHNKQLQRIQAELEEKVKELNRSNQELEQFAYVASHDLQEPLRKISFYSDVLKTRFRPLLPEDGARFFDNMMGATERMKSLIGGVLAYSQIEKELPVWGKVDLDKVAKDVISDLEIAINERNAKIILHPLPVIEGNRQRLCQLFENLVTNAIKYTSADIQPEIIISATVDKQIAIISVKDNGIGFDVKYVEKMFSIFQRLHTRDKYSGTGIGLAICKKIVDVHNGTITAHSESGKGSEFLVTLPLAQTAQKKAHI